MYCSFTTYIHCIDKQNSSKLVICYQYTVSYIYTFFFLKSVFSLSTSFFGPSNNSRQGISSPPCSKSEEYHLCPTTWRVFYLLFLWKAKKSEILLADVLQWCHFQWQPRHSYQSSFLSPAGILSSRRALLSIYPCRCDSLPHTTAQKQTLALALYHVHD